MGNVRARSLLDMLAERHADDIFVRECLMGPQGSPRLDAWVMRKTWSPATMIGYDVLRLLLSIPAALWRKWREDKDEARE